MDNKNTQADKNAREHFKKKFSTILIHLFIWLVIFSLPLLFRPNPGHRPDMPPLPFMIPIPMLMNDLFLVIAFYINLLVLMPKFFNKKKWVYYAFFTCIFLAGSFFIHTFSKEVDNLFGQHIIHGMGLMPKPPRGFEFRQFSFIFMFAMVWALSMAYFLFVQLQESIQHAGKVQASALQSELSFLKAQINPHFLFNTLNNIYALTLKKSDDAPLAVMKLSNIMRKITNDTEVDYVPFKEEESFIRDYIELQEIRLTEKTHIIYEIEGEYQSLTIAPRILIPFIDNAFKYGVSNRYESEIKISLNFKENILYFVIKNAIHPYGGESIESSGVGLENAKRRLDLLYQDKYALKIDKKTDSYMVLLKIELT